MSELAILGGKKAVVADPGDMFTWPIITKEDEDAVLDVLHKRAMSGTDITMKFEKEFAKWQGVKYALGFSSGTAALQAAMKSARFSTSAAMIRWTPWPSFRPGLRGREAPSA